MLKLLSFVKMHSQSNDMLIFTVDNFPEENSLFNAQNISLMCHRKRGIGADQFLVIQNPLLHKCPQFWIWNQDGSEAQACGNGTRCLLLYCQNQWPEAFKDINTIDLQGPVGMLKVTKDQNDEIWVRQSQTTPQVCKKNLNYNCLMPTMHIVNIGNDHGIFLNPTRSSEAFDIAYNLCQKRDVDWPDGLNVSLVWSHEYIKDGEKHIWYEIKHFERGVGETASCGSGACAIAIVLKNLQTEGKLHGEQTENEQCWRLHTYGGIVVVKFDPLEGWSHGTKAHMICRGNFIISEAA